MPRRATELKPSANLSIRLMGEEATRYKEILDKAGERQPYADKSDVIRELLCLRPLRLLTREEIRHFREAGKKEAADSEKPERKPSQKRPKRIESPPGGEDVLEVGDPPQPKRDEKDNGGTKKNSAGGKR